MAFKPTALKINMPPAIKVSTKNLTLPHGSLKVSPNVKPQHVAKVNYGKIKPISQKGSSQL